MDSYYGAAVSVLGATNTAAQIAVIAALEDDSFVQSYGEIFDRRRKFLCELVKSSNRIAMVTPESSFLAWINVGKLGKSSEIVDYLVKEAKVAVNDGHAYGPNSGEHIRVVYGCLADDRALFRALERLVTALDKY
jgi:aspartate/methionine/tyrosine aminotransferase